MNWKSLCWYVLNEHKKIQGRKIPKKKHKIEMKYLRTLQMCKRRVFAYLLLNAINIFSYSVRVEFAFFLSFNSNIQFIEYRHCHSVLLCQIARKMYVCVLCAIGLSRKSKYAQSQKKKIVTVFVRTTKYLRWIHILTQICMSQ